MKSTDKGHHLKALSALEVKMLKKITFNVEEELITKAQHRARQEHTTLNETFKEWLKQYADDSTSTSVYNYLMDRLHYADPGRKFSRDELNER